MQAIACDRFPYISHKEEKKKTSVKSSVYNVVIQKCFGDS